MPVSGEFPVVYTDDSDASATWELTDSNGQEIDWSSPQIAIGSGSYQSATWLGVPASTRQIRLNMPLGLGLDEGVYQAYLAVPGGPDISLGYVQVAART